jgi:hypothetical protein
MQVCGTIPFNMSRWIRFLLALLVGAAGGLFYGWQIDPVKYVDTTPDSLRSDYRSDYVLMVAEAYQSDHDLDLAARRLALLGSSPPAEIALDALLFAEGHGWLDADLDLMRDLYTVLQTWNPALEIPAP